MKTRAELLDFMRKAPYWVEATASADGAPQAAVVGVAVTDAFELFFDTLGSSRKCKNLRRDPRVAFVMWSGEATVQLEGVGDEPKGDELARLKALYFAAFPDGPSREAWAEITYVRVRARWLRFSDFAAAGGPAVMELDEASLTELA
jgi:hypothetical protein